MSYKGIFFIDQIHFNAYDLIELDMYAYVSCYEMTPRIKFENWFGGPRVIMLFCCEKKNQDQLLKATLKMEEI